MIDHPSQARPGIQPFPDRLYVVTAVANPCRYRTRYQLYRAFAKHMADSGVILYTVEMAFGGRLFEVTEPGNPRHVQVRGDHELWYKENLLNIGIGRLPPEARYIATIDADLTFVRPDWAQETLHQLQHCPIVQMFSEITHLSADCGQVSNGLGFMEAWQRGLPLRTQNGTASSDLFFRRLRAAGDYPALASVNGGNKELGAPGGAWAYRRDALDHLGGLIDWCVTGSGDYHMAAALLGMAELVLALEYSPGYTAPVLAWQARAERHIRRNVGVVPGMVLHHWHGRMAERKYGERWRILVKHGFDPAKDLKRDSQGLLRLEDDGSSRFIGLRDDLRSYFAVRNEDGGE